MHFIPATDIRSYGRMSTAELRASFLLADLYRPGELNLRYWETDRSVIGAAMPTTAPLALSAADELRSAYFCERRELGIINTGGAGAVTVDGQTYEFAQLDTLYVGRGAQKISFASKDAAKPAKFYLLSYPAHVTYPTTFAAYNPANAVALGAAATANDRRLNKVIHPAGIKSCQLVMGFTIMQTGSIWNTMPPHTHLRRSEVYMYFNVPESAAVMHFMGKPDETRHLVVRDHQAVLSPPWSIHSGAGTDSYGFIWGMGGENQEFADMDPAPIATLA